jgi:hypothetical protein
MWMPISFKHFIKHCLVSFSSHTLVSDDFEVNWMCIAIRFLSTKLHVVPYTQVVKTCYMLQLLLVNIIRVGTFIQKTPLWSWKFNVVCIHRFKYMSVIIRGCLVKTTIYLPLYIYSSPPLPPQTFRSIRLRRSNRSLNSVGKCVDNRTW